MDPFKLTFRPKPSANRISHGQKILFLGSCFSDEISAKAKYFGLNADSNPFGTIFHPLALSQFILQSLNHFNKERIIQRSDLFLSWDAGSAIYGMTESDLVNNIFKIRKEWSEKLKQTDFLFVTFGTAWAYKLAASGELVANCHKFPSAVFVKELTLQNEIVDKWKITLGHLKELNPNLHVIFTVSPVRHIKDGLVENNRSKAILLDSVRQLEAESKCSYFPSYEIVMDELRDYRFYKADRVHPNEEAIDYVWNRFSDVFFTEQTIKLNKEIVKLRLAEQHRTLYPESIESKRNLLLNQEIRKTFLMQNPEVILD